MGPMYWTLQNLKDTGSIFRAAAVLMHWGLIEPSHYHIFFFNASIFFSQYKHGQLHANGHWNFCGLNVAAWTWECKLRCAFPELFGTQA
jgi:hypothetical protein